MGFLKKTKYKAQLLAYSISKNTKFIIEINNGKLKITKGKVDGRFIRDCKDILRRTKTDLGFIYGYSNEYEKTSIKVFCESESLAQRIRNVWSFY